MYSMMSTELSHLMEAYEISPKRSMIRTKAIAKAPSYPILQCKSVYSLQSSGVDVANQIQADLPANPVLQIDFAIFLF